MNNEEWESSLQEKFITQPVDNSDPSLELLEISDTNKVTTVQSAKFNLLFDLLRLGQPVALTHGVSLWDYLEERFNIHQLTVGKTGTGSRSEFEASLIQTIRSTEPMAVVEEKKKKRFGII